MARRQTRGLMELQPTEETHMPPADPRAEAHHDHA